MSTHAKPTTARQRLVESSGTPFAPSSDTRPVVAVMDGRRTNDDLEPDEWCRALEACPDVAVYFELPADHEWWVAYDADADASEAFCRWSTYPSGPWGLSRLSRCMMSATLAANRGHTHDIYRSRVVCLEDAPAFVQQEVRDE